MNAAMKNVIVFLVNNLTKEVPFAGRVPQTYENMTGLDGMDYSSLRNLACLGHQHKGFLTYEDAIAAGVPVQTLDRMKASAIDIEWNSLEQERADRIQAVRWRIDRYNDQVAMDLTPTEEIEPLLFYVQAIRDLPTTQSDPFNIVWPQVPPLP